MGLNCGIVGLPNVGKSTLFNSLTAAGIDAANYPFCTIEPNVGVVNIPDQRLDQLAEIVHPQRVLHNTLEVIDIAGLVAGAASGEGLGNKFLAHIRETDAILHVVRCFENDDITHVATTVDPIRDIETINTELLLADLATLERAQVQNDKLAKTGDKHAVALQKILQQLAQHLDSGAPARSFPVDEKFVDNIKQLGLISNKPVLYVANVDEGDLTQNQYYQQVVDYAKQHDALSLPICAAIEAELIELAAEDKKEFLAELGYDEPALNKLVRMGFSLLDLQTFFTAGEKEVRAWTVAKGATAVEAAGKIHTDFARGFIRAEVVAFADFVECKGIAGAKAAGKWRLEGKNYIVNDGDIMLFLFNV